VLSCIDSRVPPEVIFDVGLGDLPPASRVLVRVGGLARRPAPVALFE
jgi:hypothetical protein